MLAAVARGLLRMEAMPPWVLDDAFALVLVGPAWQELRKGLISLFPTEVVREVLAAVCTRSRYAEDRLAAGAFAQYVILGAGLDSFAWRRPDLLRSLRVFEVDHPASQAWKLERVSDLALPLSDSQVFVPVDFEAESLQDALRTAGFDWDQRALFSWTGVARGLRPALKWCSPIGRKNPCSMRSGESSYGSTHRSRPHLASRFSPAGRSSRSTS